VFHGELHCTRVFEGKAEFHVLLTAAFMVNAAGDTISNAWAPTLMT
jgi:hypothetical protein